MAEDGSEATTRVFVPKLNRDPVWSLRPWPVTVILGTETFEIPAMPAADWLSYLMQEAPDLDGLIVDYLPASEDMLFDGLLDVDELYDRVLEVVATVCARPWWVALRQISIARASWHILGPKMMEAVDVERVSIAAWLDVLLIKALESMEPKDTNMFSAQLESPPPEIAATMPAPIDLMEIDRGSFLSMR